MKIISNKGYSIQKNKYDLETIQEIKKHLTVQPDSHPDFPPSPTFQIYEETEKYLRIPVAYGLLKFGDPDVNLLKDARVGNLHFSATLRDYQVIPVQKSIETLTEHGRGLLCLVTGAGKTVCALAIACALQQKTCIVVHKTSLLEQWKEEIARFVPQARIGIIRQKTMQLGQDYDITLAMWQTLMFRENLPPEWGLVVMDECHRVCSNVFSKVMFKINSRFVLGLSATPERSDGLTRILHWHLGDIIYRQEPVTRSSLKTLVWICKFKLDIHEEHYTRIITRLCTSDARNEYILKCIQQILARSDAYGREILVLTERVAHAKTLVELLLQGYKVSASIGLFIGETKDTSTVKQCKIIVATYKIFEEGTSIERLNTLVFASPKKKITQALGRIFRKRHDIPPIVVDIADSSFPGQMYSRIKIYKQETKNHLRIIYYNQQLNEIKSQQESNTIDDTWTWSLDKDDM